MIHIIIGTKGNLIKTAGVLRYLDQNNIPYNYIDTAQHYGTSDKLREQFNLREPDFLLAPNRKDIISNKGGIIWMFSTLFRSLFKLKRIFKNDKNGLCVIQGDTVSTLLGALIGKFGGQRVVHIEAGFRTDKLFKPFPEEIIRRFVNRIATINFACDETSYNNLIKEKNKAKLVNLGENTHYDIVQLAAQAEVQNDLPQEYVLVSIHRYETIHSKDRLSFIIDEVLKLAQDHQIVWGLHEPTKNALKKYQLLQNLEQHPHIHLRGLFPYFEFMKAIAKSKFLVTDGGGPQDETRYLNKPCLIMRTENERPNQTHVYQCDFESDKVEHFVKNLNQFYVREHRQIASPSQKIVEVLQQELSTKNA